MLLIVDEEQTGLGKLGDMFGFEAEAIVPDIITMAKHLGGGVGISAVTTSAAIEEKVIDSGYAATHSHSQRSADLRRRRGQPGRHRAGRRSGESPQIGARCTNA